MRFDIKCATFVRLASICNFFVSTTDPETRELINTVRLEAVNGKILAIATNQRIAAVEYIGQCPIGQNEVAHIILDPQLIAQCKAEAFLNSVLTINTIPQIATSNAQTSLGWSMNNVCYWFDDTPLNDWRKWTPDAPIKKSKNIMMWNLFHIQSLVESSPTGEVIFPEFIDAVQPVILRDKNDPNWVGIFVPKPHNDFQDEPATLPEWWSN